MFTPRRPAHIFKLGLRHTSVRARPFAAQRSHGGPTSTVIIYAHVFQCKIRTNLEVLLWAFLLELDNVAYVLSRPSRIIAIAEQASQWLFSSSADSVRPDFPLSTFGTVLSPISLARDNKAINK